MTFHLDSRQRAMLHEMKVHVWWPEEVTLPSTAPKPPEHATKSIATNAIPVSVTSQNDDHSGATRQRTRPASSQPTQPSPSTTSPLGCLQDNISTMSWSELMEAMHHCQACAMSAGQCRPVQVTVSEPQPCDWMVVGDPPDDEQMSAAMPFVGHAGVLLDNMLAAVGAKRMNIAHIGNVENDAAQTPRQRAYLTHVLKCRPVLTRAPERAELALCANYLRREIALIRPKVIVTMGRCAMQVLLSETPPEQAKLPLGQLRLQVWRYADVPVVVTYPPSYLLQAGRSKASAWADLCLAQDIVEGGNP